MRRLSTGVCALSILVGLLLIAPTSVWAATVIIDEDFETLDEDVWRIFRDSPGGVVRVEDGKLYIEDIDPHVNPGRWAPANWKQVGVMLREPIDLREKITTVTLTYVEAGHTEQSLGFWDDPELEEPFGGTGLLIRGMKSDVTIMPTGGAGEYLMVLPGNLVAAVSGWPLELTLVLTWDPDDVNFLDADLMLDGQVVGSCHLLMDAPDPAEVYFVIYVSDNDEPGPSVFESLVITQEPL